MKLISGALLFVTLSALVYATRDIWPQVEYDRYIASQPTAMEEDSRR